jgi:hypothetical protein
MMRVVCFHRVSPYAYACRPFRALELVFVFIHFVSVLNTDATDFTDFHGLFSLREFYSLREFFFCPRISRIFTDGFHFVNFTHFVSFFVHGLHGFSRMVFTS